MNRTELLQTVDVIINNDRQNDYGKPEDNFQKIANYWTTYLEKFISPDRKSVV